MVLGSLNSVQGTPLH